jgi:hypothetical protein
MARGLLRGEGSHEVDQKVGARGMLVRDLLRFLSLEKKVLFDEKKRWV